MPVDKRFLECKPTVIVLTHDHLDHTDPETLVHYLKEDSGVCVLASANAWNRVRAFGGNNNYVRFDSGTSWTEKDVLFTAVPAEHSDSAAVGEDIADAVWYFAAAARNTTGAELVVDGGNTVQLYPIIPKA